MRCAPSRTRDAGHEHEPLRLPQLPEPPALPQAVHAVDEAPRIIDAVELLARLPARHQQVADARAVQRGEKARGLLLAEEPRVAHALTPGDRPGGAAPGIVE